MIDEKKWSQYGEDGLEIKGITIHNTNSLLTSKQLQDSLNKDYTDQNCYHFVVDKDETIQLMPLNWKVFSTNKGKDSSFKYTISIVIANSLDDESNYMLAQNRAVILIKNLMEQYNLNYKSIYFHNDFENQIYCPHRILQIYKTKDNFIKEVF